jgi:hypothetical protein
MEPVLPETLAQRLFTEGDFAFRFGMQRPGQEWFRWDRPESEALQERHRWLSEEPGRHLAWISEALPLLQETESLFPACPSAGNPTCCSCDGTPRGSSVWSPGLSVFHRPGIFARRSATPSRPFMPESPP